MPQVNDFDMSKYAHDFSGYVRAAEMRAQTMANIGQQIGAGITAFDTKRKEKKKKSEFENLVMPDLIKKYDGDVETAKKAASSLYSNPEAYRMVQEMQKLEQEENKYQMSLEMLQQMENGNMTPDDLLKGGVDLKMIKDYISVMDATKEQPVTAGTLSGISSAMTDAGVKLDKETGGFYREDTGVPFYPLDNKNVPVDFNVKGADDYSKIYSNPSAFDEDQWKILN